jgi:hypothetical protein
MSTTEREGQVDPTTPIDGALLLESARPILKLLREDLEQRARDPGVSRALAARYEAEKGRRLTGDSLDAWRDARIAQIAASWFLSCVFVRTLEDRGLLGTARLAGPGALDSQAVFFQLAPNLTERDYLVFVFRELAELPASRDLFDRDHALVWQLAPSADASKDLLRLFRAPRAEAPAFRFGQSLTRFLGDLYQDLYEDVRKRFALLQTPDFVERFILDRTLEPAIERFGLDDTTLIDPTCGSGHFLLGAFDRLFEQQLRRGVEPRRAAHQALDAVFGADINPYAVAIARFRLMLSFLDKAGIRRLKEAPALPIHVVVADSLLHNRALLEDHAAPDDAATWRAEAFALENDGAARDVLHREYAAVVGNPPYITEKDPVKRERYRAMYPRSAAGKYALSAPFCERFFQLARERGFVGQITTYALAKREYGETLIEDCLPRVNLELIANTSEARIPGHTTPTLLLFGTHEAPAAGGVMTVLARRAETPSDPMPGPVWTSMVEHWSDPNFQNDYISVVRTERNKLAKHPWSLGGGGAVELKDLLEERADKRLAHIVEHLGIACVTGEDEVFLVPEDVATRQGVGGTRPLVIGEDVRDWSLKAAGEVLFPYDEELARLPPSQLERELRWLWPFRSVISKRKRFGTPMLERGLTWYELQELYVEKLRAPLSITFAEVATHNHFVLDRGGKVFKQTAPIIKLPPTATEEYHLALLAYLNSSTACFWMKQVCFPKSSAVKELNVDGMRPEDNRYAFSTKAISDLPLPRWADAERTALANLANESLVLASLRETLSGRGLVNATASNRDNLSTQALVEHEKVRAEARLATLQEDIDWLVYRLFGLCDSWKQSTLEHSADARPFLSSDDISDEWDERRDQRRESEQLQLLETPMFKRLWSGRRGVFGHSVQTFEAGLLTEARDFFQQKAEKVVSGSVEPTARREIARTLAAQADDVRRVAALLNEDPEHAVATALDEGDAVPFLAALRFTEQGLTKFHNWERVWAEQRIEDAGGPAPKTEPARYIDKDFASPLFWRLRGKLDVPHERFIAYPGCESDQDGEPLYGWAGWNHLQRALALAALYQKRKRDEGWTAERLTPMLAGLLELAPWLLQWHNEVDAEYGQRMGDYFAQFIDSQIQELGLTKEALEAWRSTTRATRRARKATANTSRRGAAAPTMAPTVPTAGETSPTLPAWGRDTIKEAAERVGVAAKAAAWATTLTGEALGTAALAAVLRHLQKPTSREQVERAVVVVLLPRLMLSQLDASSQRKWKSAIGPNDVAIQSVGSLGVPWNAVVRAALQQHVLVADANGRWSAGADIDDVQRLGGLDARALVALSWMESGAVADATVGEEVEVLRAA